MMDKATLPFETAFIPTEEARQCLIRNAEDSVPNNTKYGRKDSNTFKKIHSSALELSQPCGLTHRERLAWLQKRRTSGLWAQCDSCNRWRHLPLVVDRYELPFKWHCSMNPDTNLADCSAPEVPIDLRDEEDLIHSRFTAGSVVWARLPGWPWWPAMVDDCPDTEQFYWLDGFTDIPTYYNVTFFDKKDVTRAWIANEKIKPYSINKNISDRALKIKKYAKRLATAVKQAEDAFKLPLSSRLEKYSFITRYKGNITSPTKFSKADIEKYRKRLTRKFNVEFPSDSSDTETRTPTKLGAKIQDKVYSGTPKKVKPKGIKPKQLLKNENKVNFTNNSSNDTAIQDKSFKASINAVPVKDLYTKDVAESLHSKIVEKNDSNNSQASTASDDFDF